MMVLLLLLWRSAATKSSLLLLNFRLGPGKKASYPFDYKRRSLKRSSQIITKCLMVYQIMNHVHSLYWNDTSGIRTCFFPCFSTFQFEENKQWSLYYRPKQCSKIKWKSLKIAVNVRCFISKNPSNIAIPDKCNKPNQPRRLHFMSEAGPAMKIWSTLTHGEGPGHAHWAKPNQRINLSELANIQFIWSWWGCIKNQWINLYIANEPPMLSMLKTFETWNIQRF